MKKRTGITIDEGTWHRFRVACRILDRNSGDVLEEIIRVWLVETKPQITQIYQELAQEVDSASPAMEPAEGEANTISPTISDGENSSSNSTNGNAAIRTTPQRRPIKRKQG